MKRSLNPPIEDRSLLSDTEPPNPIAAIRGMFGPGWNLEETLYEMRREERLHEDA